MNNTSKILELVNKIPISVYFSQLPDRQQALKYLEYLYKNIPESQNVNSEQLFREVISRELRGVSMKITEPEILILVALDKITLADFSLSSQLLINKVIQQNPDTYDLDVMQRIMAQIMTKLPRDLKERVSAKDKFKIFQLVAGQLKMNPQLLEKFANYDASLNNAITMELDSGDYNNLNKKYLQELYNYQKKQPYISSNNLEYGSLAAEIALSQDNKKKVDSNVSRAQYIDQSPDLMVGVNDNTLYYFDPSSGTLSEMPLNKNQTPVSIQDLQTILASQKINQADIQNAINSIHSTAPNTTIPNTTIPASFFTELENTFKGLITGTTQAQAVIQTTSNITPTEPVPPAFLTKLYNLKHGKNKDDDINNSIYFEQNNTVDFKPHETRTSTTTPSTTVLNPSTTVLNPSTTVLNPSTTVLNPSTTSSTASNTIRGSSLVDFVLTNPLTTYKAFSGLAPHETRPPTTTIPITTTHSNTQSTAPTTTSTPTTSTTTVSTTTTTGPSNSLNTTNTTKEDTTALKTISNTKSNFANLVENSEVISTEQTIAAKIKNDNKNVEKIAIGFITILILIFLIAVITYVKNIKTQK